MNESTVTLIVAGLTAATALYGYISERRKERELELAKIRHQIYEDFVANYFEGKLIVSAISADPNCPKGNVAAFYAFAFTNHPKFAAYIEKGLKTNTLLSIYAADEAVKAAASFMLHSAQCAQGLRVDPPDVGALVLELRRHLFAPPSSIKKTAVTSQEINQLMTP